MPTASERASSGEVVGNKAECCGYVEGFADTHESAQPVDLLKRGAVAHEQSYCGPNAEAADYKPFAIELVGYGP